MSGLPPETLRSMRQAAPQVAEGTPNAPLHVPPVILLPNGTFCTVPPFLGAHGPNYAPTFQGHSAVPTLGLRMPMDPNLLHLAIFNSAFSRNSASASAPQLSRPAGYLEPPTPVTFQPPLTSMQPGPSSGSDRQQALGASKPPKKSRQVRRTGRWSDKGRRATHVAAAVHPQSDQTINQVRSGQNNLQVTWQDDAVEGLSEQPGHLHRTDCQPDKDLRVAHVAATANLLSNQTNNEVRPGQSCLQAARQDSAVERSSEQPGQVDATDHQPDKDFRVTYVAPAANLQSKQTNNQAYLCQTYSQAIEQDNVAEKLSKEPGEVGEGDNQPDNDPRPAPAVCLQGNEMSTPPHPLERNFSVHTCMNNPDSECARVGTFCLDAFHTFIGEGSVTLSIEEISRYVSAAMFPEDMGEEQPVNQPAHGATDATSSNNTNTLSILEMASPSSGMVNSTSTAVCSPPTGSPSASEQLRAAGSPSTNSRSCSAGKRQRSEDCSEDRPQKQQRTDRMDIAPDDRSEAWENEVLDFKNDSIPPEEKYEYICRICMIHAKVVTPLPCEDELRRHIESMHQPFLVLFDHEGLNILKPRRSDWYENLMPLIRFCIPLQLQAQQRGMVISPERDLTTLYPHIAAFLNHY